MNHNNRATFLIFTIPIVWGLGFTLTHNAVRIMDPGVFAFCRQIVASLCLLPFALPYAKQINRQTLTWSFLIGLLGALNVLCQSYALTSLASAQIAFFVTINIIFVPFLAYFFKISKINILDVGAIGLGILSIIITFNGNLVKISTGDLLGICAAFLIASNIIAISIMVKHCSANRILLTCMSCLFGCIILSPFFESNSIEKIANNSTSLAAILFQGCISTAAAYFIQIKYQKDVGPTKTALILNMDLFFAAIFGLINGEALQLHQIIGGCVAFLSTIFQDIIKNIKKHSNKLYLNKT
jgi:drug/metabolite transporter (DMT)-like permease